MGEQMKPSELIRRLLDEVGQHEGVDGIRAIVSTGYRGTLTQALLSCYDGDDNAARRAIQRLAREREVQSLNGGRRSGTSKSYSELRTWARTVELGAYLAMYEDDGLDEASDSGSRCGYGDSDLAQVKADLRPRGLTLSADDRGLRVVEVQS